MPPPLPVFADDIDEDAGGRPKTVEDCLEAIYALIRAEQVEIDRNKWSIDEIEEIQAEDHASVIIHRRLIDDTIRRLDKTRIALVKLKRNIDGNPEDGGVVRQSHHLTLQDISNMTGSYVEGLDEHGRRLFVEPEMLDDGKTEAGKK